MAPTSETGQSVLTTKLVRVPHLFGISLSYHLHKPLVGSKPTLVLIPNLLASASSFVKQVTDAKLEEQCNLLVFEPLGHGGTKVVGGEERSWTYWDSAQAFLQGLEALNVKKAFVLGVSQGGWIAMRMALLSPDKVRGVIAIGSNFEAQNEKLKALGCADLEASMMPVVTQLTTTENAEFKLPEGMAKDVAKLAIGASPDVDTWASQINAVYVGELGRQKLRQSVLSLLTRESLHLRFPDLKPSPASSTAGAAITAVASAVAPGGAAAFPILIIRGTADEVFSKEATEADVLALGKAGLKDVTFKEVSGSHAANWSSPEEVNPLIVEYLKKYGGKVDARALREAVGMVDI